MLKVAITGNIASGKSTVENFIQGNGYEVYDADKIAHKILEKSLEVKKLFGTTDRKEIAKIVFNYKDKLKELESIIHPQVKLEFEKIFNNVESIVFISVPLLFEAGYETLFDKIIFVSAEENIRLERLMKRNNLSKEEALMRIKVQDSEAEKIKKSDFIIFNNNDVLDLECQIREVLSNIC